MNERIGILAALISSTLGGMAAAVTRFAVSAVDPITMSAFRFAGGFLLLMPIALLMRSRLPHGRDRLIAALLGIMVFCGFFVIYAIAFSYTTAARGGLAVTTLPLMTMVVAAIVGVERLAARKTIGVLLALVGVTAALLAGLRTAPPQAWRGDLMMLGGVLLLAFFNVWSRPFIARSSPLGFITVCMGFGGAGLTAVALATGGGHELARFHTSHWAAMIFLAACGGAGAFYLWTFALRYTTPTRVAITGTVTPIAAGLLAAVIVGESFSLDLVLGLIVVAAGIWLATTDTRVRAQPK